MTTCQGHGRGWRCPKAATRDVMVDGLVMHLCATCQPGAAGFTYGNVLETEAVPPTVPTARPVVLTNGEAHDAAAGRPLELLRMVTPQPVLGRDQRWRVQVDGCHFEWDEAVPQPLLVKACPFGKVGDVLWAQEPWARADLPDGVYIAYQASPDVGLRAAPDRARITYMTPHPRAGGPWCNAEDMPAWASRHRWTIAAVHCERDRGGVWFVPLRPLVGLPQTRPDPLAALLAPPPPPFIAGLPLYGIDHGGEANAHRAIWWDDAGRLVLPADPLIKLQSKHTALYAEVSDSAERYRLQVDDAADITVDVALWRGLRGVVEALLLEMRRAGVGAEDARAALTSLRPPTGYRVATQAWRERVAPLRPHVGARWWGLFLGLVPMPELVRQERAVVA